MKRRRRSAGRPGARTARGVCEGRRRRPRGGGVQELGRRVSLLAERLLSSSVVPLPAPRPPAPQLLADAAPRPHSSSPALAGTKAPPGPGRREAVPRSRLRLLRSGLGNFRPHRVAQRPAPAAEGTTESRPGFQGPGHAVGRERGHGAGLRISAGDVGELTDRSANRRGRNASGS